MEVVLAIVGAAVVVLVATRLVIMGRSHREERREVEEMFSPGARDRDWWDERH